MRIACIQLGVDDFRKKNDRVEIVKNIFDGMEKDELKPDLVMLPELWGCGFFNFDEYEKAAEDLTGQTVRLLCEYARKMECYILTGSFIRKEDSDLFNTSVLIDKDGEIVGKYDKIHLFGYESREQKILTKGSGVSVLKTKFGKVGLATCYDLRFPEQFRAMQGKGVKAFLIVSAWPKSRLSHWNLFTQVRALENQCYLIACNCSGTQAGSEYAGNSVVVSPRGDVVAQAGQDKCVLVADIDLSEVDDYRKEFPAVEDQIEI